MTKVDRNLLRRTALFRCGMVLAVVISFFANSAWAAHYKVLYKFRGSQLGRKPYAGLTFDSDGNLYGTTESGGAYGRPGTVFELIPTPSGPWTEHVLYSFKGKKGKHPFAGVTFDSAGNLYGTTLWGGKYIWTGTVFKLSHNPDGSWKETVLHSFSPRTDTENPMAAVVFDAQGNLYGTAGRGPGFGNGDVFKLTPNPDGTWTATILHSFAGGADGWWPYGDLIIDAAGNLYGTTLGGYYDYQTGSGTVFKLAPNPDGTWTKTVIHSFAGGTDGLGPYAGVIMDAKGNLYGTTEQGGQGKYSSGYGTVFMLTPNPDGSWGEKILHRFNLEDGSDPVASLAMDAVGNLYGTTRSGGDFGNGTVFKLSPNPDGTWKRIKLHSFNGQDGANPRGKLVLDAAGNLYGTASLGGKGHGVAFKITP
jgi:uncharacterized repeat protein (TIGR03803 family)